MQDEAVFHDAYIYWPPLCTRKLVFSPLKTEEKSGVFSTPVRLLRESAEKLFFLCEGKKSTALIHFFNARGITAHTRGGVKNTRFLLHRCGQQYSPHGGSLSCVFLHSEQQFCYSWLRHSLQKHCSGVQKILKKTPCGEINIFSQVFHVLYVPSAPKNR